MDDNISPHFVAVARLMSLLTCIGYDGVDEFFPSLLELIQCKISGTDVPPVANRTSGTTQRADNGNIAETVCAAARMELGSSSRGTEANCVVTNLDQSTSWFYFSSDFCSECIKSPTLCSQLERPLPDGQGSLERAVAVNGFAEH